MKRGTLGQAAHWLETSVPKTVEAVGLEMHILLAEDAEESAEGSSPVGRTRRFRKSHRTAIRRPTRRSQSSVRLRGRLRLGDATYLSNVAYYNAVILKGRRFRKTKRYPKGRWFGSKQARKPLYPVIGRRLMRNSRRHFARAVRRARRRR